MGKLSAPWLATALVAISIAGCSSDKVQHAAPADTLIDSGPASLVKDAAATFTFHSDQADAAFICQVDSAAPTSCASPFTVTVVEGSHQFNVAAINARGEADLTPASQTWVVDLTAPQTTLTAQPPALDNSANPTFEFSGDNGGGPGTLTFECALDAAAFAACTSPTTLAGVPDGMHTFAVRAVDTAGNPDASPATVTWVIDTTLPNTQITGGPTAGSTTNARPQFTFTSTTANVTFECHFDAAPFAACTSPLTPAALADGAHTFTVRAKDQAGVVDPSPPSIAWTVDAIAPDVQIVTTPPDPSNTATPTFTFLSSDATATFECQLDNGAFAACASPFVVSTALPEGNNTFFVRSIDPVGNRSTTTPGYAWTVDTIPPTVAITAGPSNPTANASPAITFATAGAPATTTCQLDANVATACSSPYATGALLDGSHTVTVTVVDAAGNSASAMTTFVVDTTPPTVTITMGPTSPTKNRTPSFTFTAPGAATITCAMDGGGFAACTSPFTTATLVDGPHTFVVKGADALGNAATASYPFTVDTTAPTVTLTTSPANPTNAASGTFAFTIGGGPATTTCQVDAGAATACTSPFVTGTLADGSHTVTIAATDAAGNTGTASKTYTIDTVAPVVTVTAQPSSPTNQTGGTVMFTVTGGATSTTCKLDGGAATTCGGTYTVSGLTDGSHTVTITSTDAAGNAGTATATWTVDTGAPVVTITSQPTNPTAMAVATVAFTITGAATSITCQLDAGAFTACTSPYTTAALADGAHTITVKATDAANNSGTAFATFTVDTTAPTVTITSQPPANTNNATPTVTFTVTGGAVSTTCKTDAGAATSCGGTYTTAMLADGPHTITIVSTDAVGNATTKVVSFTVDTVAPTVMITTTFATPTSNTKPPISFTTAGSPSTIQCQIDGGTLAACTSPFTPGTALADGPHTITVKVTDLATNTSSASVMFTVDTVPPTINFTSVPTSPTNNNLPSVGFAAGGGATSTLCQVDAGGFNACTSPFTVGTALADGSHTIFVRALDAASNATTISTTFTVDTVAPTVTITTTFSNPTSNPKPPISFTTAGGPTSITCAIDGGTANACTSPFTPGANLTEGAHTIVVRVADAAGNASTDMVMFTVDTIAPTATITMQPSNPTNQAMATIMFTTAGSPTITECRADTGTYTPCSGSFTTAALTETTHTISVHVVDSAGNQSTATTSAFLVDVTPPTISLGTIATPSKNQPSLTFSAPGAVGFECTVNGGAFAACTSPFTPSPALADGDYTISVRATDAAGNPSVATTPTFTIDTMLTLTVTPVGSPTTMTQPPVSFSVMFGPATFTCRIDSGATNACTSPFTPSALGDGSHTITVTARDAAGNTATGSTTFLVDTTPPVVTITAGPDHGWPAASTQTYTYTVSGDPPTMTCVVDATTVPCTTTQLNLTGLAPGPHTVTITAKDQVSLTGTATATSTVDPTVLCLDGSKDHGDAFVTGLLDALGPATIEFWYRAPAKADATIVAIQAPSLIVKDPEITIATTSSGTALLFTIDSTFDVTMDGTVNTRKFTPAGYDMTQWHHYAFVTNGTTTKLFLDGVEVTTAVQVAGAQTAQIKDALGGTTAPISLALGYHPRSGAEFAAGGLLDLRISSAALYAATFVPQFPLKTPQAATAVLQYPLDEGDGLASFDATHNDAVTITWSNAAVWSTCF